MLGGRSGNQVELNSVERFNPETSSWEMVKEMNMKRWSPGVTVFHKQIVVLGGRGESALGAEVYDEKHDSWTEMTSVMPRGNTRYSVCSVIMPPDWAYKRDPVSFHENAVREWSEQ